MEELAKIYSASSIVMNLSLSESFGKTTVEGLSCGVPGIVNDCTASPELVDEKTGIVVHSGDVKSVLNAVDTIMSWDRTATAMACRKRATELFNIHNNWPKYIELYKRVLRENNYL